MQGLVNGLHESYNHRTIHIIHSHFKGFIVLLCDLITSSISGSFHRGCVRKLLYIMEHSPTARPPLVASYLPQGHVDPDNYRSWQWCIHALKSLVSNHYNDHESRTILIWIKYHIILLLVTSYIVRWSLIIDPWSSLYLWLHNGQHIGKSNMFVSLSHEASAEKSARKCGQLRPDKSAWHGVQCLTLPSLCKLLGETLISLTDMYSILYPLDSFSLTFPQMSMDIVEPESQWYDESF